LRIFALNLIFFLPLAAQTELAIIRLNFISFAAALIIKLAREKPRYSL